MYAAPPTASASTFAARAVGEARSTSLPDDGDNQVQSGAIRCNQVQSEALPYLMREAIRFNQVQSGAIRSTSLPSARHR